jgi:hypothetical protein
MSVCTLEVGVLGPAGVKEVWRAKSRVWVGVAGSWMDCLGGVANGESTSMVDCGVAGEYGMMVSCLLGGATKRDPDNGCSKRA